MRKLRHIVRRARCWHAQNAAHRQPHPSEERKQRHHRQHPHRHRIPCSSTPHRLIPHLHTRCCPGQLPLRHVSRSHRKQHSRHPRVIRRIQRHATIHNHRDHQRRQQHSPQSR